MDGGISAVFGVMDCWWAYSYVRAWSLGLDDDDRCLGIEIINTMVGLGCLWYCSSLDVRLFLSLVY